MREAIKELVLRCPCGIRMQAANDEALSRMLHEHVEREHPYQDAPPEERIMHLVSSAVYGFEFVPLGPEDGLEAQGFGPEPY